MRGERDDDALTVVEKLLRAAEGEDWLPRMSLPGAKEMEIELVRECRLLARLSCALAADCATAAAAAAAFRLALVGEAVPAVLGDDFAITACMLWILPAREEDRLWAWAW